MIESLLSGSLAFIMFSLGISLTYRDFLNALKQPKALLAGIITQIILLPLVAFLLIQFFKLQGEIALGIMILSCCPGGITSNVITKWSKGDVALSISYTSLASLATAGTLPLILSLSAPHILPVKSIDFSIVPLSIKVFTLSTLPVLIGVVARRIAPMKSKTWEIPCGKIANTLFALVLIGVLVGQWDVFIANLPILGPILFALNLIMLTIGLAIGQVMKLKPPKVTSLAVEAGFQNGTIGIVVGSLISETLEQGELSSFSLPSAVYSVLMMITIVPFIIYRRRTKPA